MADIITIIFLITVIAVFSTLVFVIYRAYAAFTNEIKKFNCEVEHFISINCKKTSDEEPEVTVNNLNDKSA